MGNYHRNWCVDQKSISETAGYYYSLRPLRLLMAKQRNLPLELTTKETMSGPGTLPPPPPLPPKARTVTLKTTKLTNTSLDLPYEHENLWAKDFPDIQKSCYFSSCRISSKPVKCEYFEVPSILQEGPTCGLTAVSMLLLGDPSPGDILLTAKSKQFTNFGEMFSTNNLQEILSDVAPRSVQSFILEGILDSKQFKEELVAGGCAFVSYDPDHTHSPCLKNGMKAHWALIVGYLIDEDDKFYVIARHGKARNFAIWNLKELSESNSNLMESCQPKGFPAESFVIPEGGIAGAKGLRNRCIIVKSLQHLKRITIV